MVDIHSHIIPGVDDGAADLKTALRMLRIAADDGIRHIVATPHYINGEMETSPEIIREKCRELSQACAERNIPINIYEGNEVSICPEIPTLLEEKAVCTLNGSRYVLVELPLMGMPIYTREVFYEILLKGYVPILAHPERNSEIQANLKILRELTEAGVLVQVNSSSIRGFYGKKIANTASKMIASGLVHFVSSDAHTSRTRSPRLAKAREIVEQKRNAAAAELYFEKNGIAVLENRFIPPADMAGTGGNTKMGFWASCLASCFRKLRSNKQY